MKETVTASLKRAAAVVKQHSAVFATLFISVITLCMLTGMTLALHRITITDNGQAHTVYTLRKEQDTVLASAGVSLRPDDIVTVSDTAIRIDRAFSVQVSVEGGDTTALRVTGGTVADALRLANVNAVTHILSTHSLTDPLTANMVIEAQPYPSKLRTETEKTGYKTKLTFTTDLPAGNRVVEQKGMAGTHETVYRDYYKDGELLASEVVSETLIEPIPELITVGDNPKSPAPGDLIIDENGVPEGYKALLTGDACAYSARKGAHTATGSTVALGTVAVNPKIIPYGSKLYIVSENGKYVYGYGIAADTGTALMKNIIIADLFMDTVADCRKFGRRQVRVYILE